MTNFRVIAVFTFVITAVLLFVMITPTENDPSTNKASLSSLTKTYTLDKPSIEVPISEKPKTNRAEVSTAWNKSSINEASQWGEQVAGVKNRIDTEEKIIALTFDACGGPFGEEYDEELIQFLQEESIPATLFFNARWIEANEEIFLELADDPLFSVQNHGTNHLPLSTEGKSAWGIEGTNSVDDVINEVMENQDLIYDITNENPAYFRSGTAYYDDIAVEIVQDLGLEVVNYDILGDAGATYQSSQVEAALLQSESGSIPLLHMNQPNSGTAEGVRKAVPQLLANGYEFVLLDDYNLIQ